MRNRIVSMRGWLKVLFAVIVVAGCGDLRQELQVTNERDALRLRADAPRNRLWVLALDEVRVYDTARMSKRLIRKIALPSWSVAGFRAVCMPDMALDAAGAAVISSNAQARLLRISGDNFALTDHAISFHEGGQRDSGFGALAFAADGTLYARTTPGGLLWKIDINKASAIMSPLNNKLPLDECLITTPLLNGFERNQQP
jgi:hypothetical protein